MKGAIEHTPGPWSWMQSNEGEKAVLWNKDHTFVLWAESINHNEEPRMCQDFTGANARLIAAAPELAEALESALVQLRQFKHPSTLVIRQAMDALEKAGRDYHA